MAQSVNGDRFSNSDHLLSASSSPKDQKIAQCPKLAPDLWNQSLEVESSIHPCNTYSWVIIYLTHKDQCKSDCSPEWGTRQPSQKTSSKLGRALGEAPYDISKVV